MDKFSTKPETRPSSSKSLHLHFMADDWWQVWRLLQDTVVDVYNKRAQLLNNTVMNFMTENKILQYRLDGVTEALHNEKKKRHWGKPLFTHFNPPEEGKATFYSSGKIRQTWEL